MTLGGRDGPGRHRGPHHPGAGAHRVPAGGVPRRADAAEDGDQRRHRPVHRRSSGWSTPGSCARPDACRDPGRARHRRLPRRLAAGGVRRRAAGHDRDAGPQGAAARSSSASSARPCWPSSSRRSPTSASFTAPARSTRTGWGLNVPGAAGQLRRHPRLRAARPLQPAGLVRARSASSPPCLLVFTLMLADFFDTMGTMAAIGAEAGLLDEEGNPPNAQRILVVDSVAAAAGGAASVSSNTSYIESASGVGEGARTGLASVVTGVLFLLATFLSPAGVGRPVRGGDPGPGHRRLPDDARRSGASTGTTSRSPSRRSSPSS